ncbi:hypothetical protein CEXT_160821 [Caerostris extrusa]|uniref:FERM domain-containing protein n=1 Tax=Caerostris extrusa TaxID=172846 RepID=A0AAV4UYL6_CAEEX|nr:hypothetical protein CEXT_160821 [Caerostris extrusa]
MGSSALTFARRPLGYAREIRGERLPSAENSRGQQLLDVVFKHLNLMETAYFGLRFIDSTGQRHWLDEQKCCKTDESQAPLLTVIGSGIGIECGSLHVTCGETVF